MGKPEPFFKPGKLPQFLGGIALIVIGLCAARFGWFNGIARLWVNHEIKTMREAGEKIAIENKAQK